MDTFFKDIYAPIIFKWLSYQKDNPDGIHVSTLYNSPEYQTIHFDLKNYQGTMTLWSKGIIEEDIRRKDTGEFVFYLHYAFINIPHFMKMYREFYKALIKHAHEKTIRIAICCSGGFTATIFSQMINASVSLSDTPLRAEALAFYQLSDLKKKYDAIYLAPQIAGAHPRLLQKIKTPLYEIDPLIYGSKNVDAFLKSISEQK